MEGGSSGAIGVAGRATEHSLVTTPLGSNLNKQTKIEVNSVNVCAYCGFKLGGLVL